MTAPSPPTAPVSPKPGWLKVKIPADETYFSVSALLEKRGLHTICRSARCPNIGECWAAKTATFLILGDICTRTCAFCAVAKGRPEAPPAGESERVAEAAVLLGLRYVVLTSVTRDDLPDGGASRFAAAAAALRRRIPGVRIETLVPDFGGDPDSLALVLDAAPDILNHNLETVEDLYPDIGRPAGHYRRSLGLLGRAKARGFTTKSGLMVGLGETEAALARTFRDLRGAGCDLLTIGQYLQPTRTHAPVVRYYPPRDFAALREAARAEGFAGVVAGPLVRSSYHAHELHASLGPGRKDPSCAH